MVCDGSINLQIYKSTCDFCQIFLPDFVWFTKKYQMYIYCTHLFRSLFIIPSQIVIGKILPAFGKGV